MLPLLDQLLSHDFKEEVEADRGIPNSDSLAGRRHGSAIAEHRGIAVSSILNSYLLLALGQIISDFLVFEHDRGVVLLVIFGLVLILLLFFLDIHVELSLSNSVFFVFLGTESLLRVLGFLRELVLDVFQVLLSKKGELLQLAELDFVKRIIFVS